MNPSNTSYAGAALASMSLLFSPAALAHVGHGDTQGFLAGLTHPLAGLDHLLAMVAVGIWAVQRGQGAQWRLPVVFAVVMALGGALGMDAIPMAGIEAGIALSSLILGGMVLARVALSQALAAALVGVLALFHGYAHGAELPAGASGVRYAAGFVAATLSLHFIGAVLGSWLQDKASGIAVRGMGAGIASAGALFLVAAIG